MTSKEIVAVIKGSFASMNKDCEEQFNQIERDLEVLEILKPMLEIKKGSSWEYLDVKHCFFDTQEQIDKVKEWLENDK